MDIFEITGIFVTKKYKSILIISSLFTLLMLFFLSKLTLNMQFMDILPKNDPAVIEYKSAMENFDSLDNLIVGVEGEKENIEAFIEKTANDVKKIEYITNVEYKIEENFLKKHGLALIKENDLKNSETIFKANNLKDFFTGINENFEKSYTSSSDTEKIDKEKIKLISTLNLLEDIIKKIKTGTLSEKEAERFFIGEKYFISNDHSLGIFIIKSNVSIDEIEKIVKSVNEIETFLTEESKKFNVRVSLTGTHVIARDEMIVSEKDSTMSMGLSLILIFILFVTAFKLLRYSLLVLVPLICGIIWSMGLTYLIIGSLNMITAMMGAILIGLGIDYSIHIISFFLEERSNGSEVKDAVISVFNKVIKGVISGALTTAVGFFMFSFSDFPGFKQFGIVLSLGIMCALISALFVLPSLLVIFGNKELKKVRKTIKIFENIEKPVIQFKKITFTILIIAIIFFGIKGFNIKFETDMMKIEAKGLASVALNRKMIEKFDFSSDNSLIVSESLEQSLELYEQADKLKTIGQISSIGQYLPLKEKQIKRLEIIKDIVNESKYPADDKLYLDDFREELYRLESNIIELSDLAYMGGETDLNEKCDTFISSGIIGELADNINLYKDNISNSQLAFISSLKKLITNFIPDIFSLDELPANIKKTYIGKDQKFLTILLPKEDLWESNFQKFHMEELNTLNKNITGSSVIFLKVVEAEIHEGKKVIFLTIIAIYLILLIDMKSFKYATLSILPMIFTVLVTLGIMSLLGIKLDVVNVIGLPLIIGIGVDDGVHIIHRYLREKDLLIALNSTGKSITLTTITTIAAFGTLILAEYRGFVNFGKLLFIGVSVAYIVTIFLLVSFIAIVDKVNLLKK